MPTTHISKRTVDASQPGNRDTYLWDDELSGFGLKVTPRGRKVYLVQYRLGGRNGRTRRVTIGVHGRVTPDQARLEARRLLGLVSTGVDPAEQKQQEKGQPTFEDLLELFFSQHVNSKLKNNTAASYERLCRLHLPSSIRKMRIVDVGRKHVTRLHHDMRTKPYAANAVLAVMSKFFNWCEKHGYALDDSSTSIAMCQVCDVI